MYVQLTFCTSFRYAHVHHARRAQPSARVCECKQAVLLLHLTGKVHSATIARYLQGLVVMVLAGLPLMLPSLLLQTRGGGTPPQAAGSLPCLVAALEGDLRT